MDCYTTDGYIVAVEKYFQDDIPTLDQYIVD